jgi:hypothetical protein
MSRPRLALAVPTISYCSLCLIMFIGRRLALPARIRLAIHGRQPLPPLPGVMHLTRDG